MRWFSGPRQFCGPHQFCGPRRIVQLLSSRIILSLSLIGASILLVTPARGQSSNPIVVENQQPGTSQWRIPFSAVGSDGVGQIKGYASAASVNKGENITLYVSVNPAQSYTIDIYRMGWYQGLGAHLVQHVGPLNGVQQPNCPTDGTTGMIECHWAPAYTLATQTSWTSGVYLATLTNSQQFQNYIVFTVRDDSRAAALLYQLPVTTYQAYNDYPYDNVSGKSLYAFNSFGANTVSGGPNAVKVSFDRPYSWDGLGGIYSNTFLYWDYPAVRWLEKSGYDITYSTDVDTHVNGGSLLNYRGILSGGHDEYWSKPMYDAWITARDAGVNLAFLGADANDWQIRFESSGSGVPNRVIVCYRDARLDPVTDPSLTTIEWSDPLLNRPQQKLVGIQYATQVNQNPQTQGWDAYIVTNSGNWVYTGTGFNNGDSVPSIVGYEADRMFTQYPLPDAVPGTYTLLSQSPLVPSNLANSSIYQAPSGAWVFATGTIAWSWALDSSNGYNFVDSRIQQVTANILNAFLTGVAPTITTFAPASGPVATSVTINGTNFTGATAVAFNGSAANFTVTSATAIQTTVPAGATTGPITVTTSGGTATSGSNFAVAPTITSFTPTNGRVGTSVTINGTSFTGATAVAFNGNAASFTVTSDATIQTTMPAWGTSGPITVATSGV